ncbi:MAG TPA: adenosylmethionine--8-amino-7-oxononanoate transaminase [bacterium]|jgi:adenosylmethionine-8-amino-7-oxononanoate aminotransferase|nr:adenosylmethionine--8-amino-7-oxononanoate transaminase [bacterium]
MTDKMNHKQLAQKDKKYLWHPFTQQQEWERDQDITIITRGKGTYLYDAKGKKYLDGVSSLWCNVHGHQVPEIDRAIQKQLKKIAHSTMLGASNEPAILLAEKLATLAPKGLTRVFYSDSGSEANEIAMKMAFQYWQQTPSPRREKKLFLTVREGYHGDTVGSVSLGGIDLFHGIFGPLLFKTLKVKSPHQYSSRHVSNEKWLRDCVGEAEGMFRKYGSRLAAVHMEPLIEGAGGMLVHPWGYLKAIRRLCDRYNVLLILDEVATGFGRTGTMFACEQEGVRPDILCVAKNLTGGYLPVAATLTTEKIYRAFLGKFESARTFYHGHTFTGNQLGCAAALANLELIKKKSFLGGIQAKSKMIEELLEPLAAHPHVSDIRLRGLMGGIELIRDKKTGKPYPYEMKIGYRVCAEAKKGGVLLRPLGNVIVLMPPLAINKKDLALLIEVISKSIDMATGNQ